jgi:hypothetical protein
MDGTILNEIAQMHVRFTCMLLTIRWRPPEELSPIPGEFRPPGRFDSSDAVRGDEPRGGPHPNPVGPLACGVLQTLGQLAASPDETREIIAATIRRHRRSRATRQGTT